MKKKNRINCRKSAKLNLKNVNNSSVSEFSQKVCKVGFLNKAQALFRICFAYFETLPFINFFCRLSFVSAFG